jgi:hypothetical protein
MGVCAESPAASPLAKVTTDQTPPEKWPAMAEAGDPLARADLLGTDGKAAQLCLLRDMGCEVRDIRAGDTETSLESLKR